MITTTSSTPTNASASLWPGNSTKLRLTQPVHRTATASNPVRFPADQTRGLAPIVGVGVFALLVILFMSQSVRLGRVYLTGPIVFVVGRAVLGRTLISGGSTTQHHRDDLGADALTTLPNSSRFSCAVPLPSRAGSFLLVSRSIGAGCLVARPVPRNQSLACAAARRRARSDRCLLGHGHRAQPGFSGAGATNPERRECQVRPDTQLGSRHGPAADAAVAAHLLAPASQPRVGEH